jgi:hypothetical protein
VHLNCSPTYLAWLVFTYQRYIAQSFTGRCAEQLSRQELRISVTLKELLTCPYEQIAYALGLSRLGPENPAANYEESRKRYGSRWAGAIDREVARRVWYSLVSITWRISFVPAYGCIWSSQVDTDVIKPIRSNWIGSFQRNITIHTLYRWKATKQRNQQTLMMRTSRMINRYYHSPRMFTL